MRARAARTADLDQLLLMIKEHAAFERAAACIGRPQLAELLASMEPPVRLCVAEQQEVCVGYCALTFDYSLWRGSRWAHLDCLFVHASHRGRGIGRLLLMRAAKIARAGGADRLEWQTPEWNAGAVRFYERIGASGEVKRRFHLPL